MSMCLIVALIAAVPQSAFSQGDRSFATIVVNAQNHGEAVVFLRLPDVLIRSKDLESFGVRVAGGTRSICEGAEYVSLRSLAPKITFVFDSDHLTIEISADPALFASHTIDLAAETPTGIRYDSDPNAFLNYSIGAASASRISAFVEGGINTRSFLADTTLSLAGRKVIRGLSYLERDDRLRLRKLIVGDAFMSVGELAGTAVISGISLQRNFDFDPYLQRMPLPGLHAAVSSPSTADIYVNDVLVRRIAIDPGQFDLQNIPATNGLNTTNIVIRDAFGRVRTYGSTVYESSGLLRPGLVDYAFAAGALRRGLLTGADTYTGPFAATARYARGISDRFTVGAHFESGRGGDNAGAQFSAILGSGAIHFALAASRFEARAGGAYIFQYALTNKKSSYGFSAARTGPFYATLGLRERDDRSLSDLSAFWALPIGARNGVVFSGGKSVDRDFGARSHIQMQTSAQLSTQFYLSLTANRYAGPNAHATNISANLTMALGPNTVASSSVETTGGAAQAQLHLQRSNGVGPGFGYELTFASGSPTTMESSVRYQSPYSEAELISGGAFGQPTRTSISLSGGIAAIGGGVYFSRPLEDGFAVIDAHGAAHLRVFLNNQYVGSTNRRGALLVPGLLPYYGNSIGLSTKDAPLNLSIAKDYELVAPRYHGGMLVRFVTSTLETFVGSIVVQHSGSAFAPGYGELTLRGKSRDYRSDLTESGGFYLENVPAGSYVATVKYRDGVCTFDIALPQTKALQTNLGGLICTKR